MHWLLLHPRGNKSGQSVPFKTKIYCIVIVSMSCSHIVMKLAGINEKHALHSVNYHNWAEYRSITLIRMSIFVVSKGKSYSFVLGKSYSIQLKQSSTYASSCKVLVQLVVRPFLFTYYIEREVFSCFFS